MKNVITLFKHTLTCSISCDANSCDNKNERRAKGVEIKRIILFNKKLFRDRKIKRRLIVVYAGEIKEKRRAAAQLLSRCKKNWRKGEYERPR